MPQPIKHIVRNDRWLDAAFDARLAQEADFKVSIVKSHGDEAAGWASLLLRMSTMSPLPKTNCPRACL